MGFCKNAPRYSSDDQCKPIALDRRYFGQSPTVDTSRVCQSLVAEIEGEYQTTQPSRPFRASLVAGKGPKHLPLGQRTAGSTYRRLFTNVSLGFQFDRVPALNRTLAPQSAKGMKLPNAPGSSQLASGGADNTASGPEANVSGGIGNEVRRSLAYSVFSGTAMS